MGTWKRAGDVASWRHGREGVMSPSGDLKRRWCHLIAILDQTTELTELELVMSDLLDNPRLIVEPDLAWVMKNPKTIVHSHFWAVWFIPTIVPSTLPPFLIRS